MEYKKYLREVDQAADATDGKVVSLAGGYFSVQSRPTGPCSPSLGNRSSPTKRGQVRFGYWATLGPPGPDDGAM